MLGQSDRIVRIVREQRAEEAERGLRAMALAPTLAIYHALMRGEDVPVEKLNAEALTRYGLRRK